MDYQPVNLALHGERQGAVPPVDAGALRLLGDRVRVPRRSTRRPRRRSSPASPRAARPIRCSRSRPTQESAAGHRPGGQPVRLRRRSAGLPRRCASSSRASCGRGLQAKAARAGQPYDVLRRSFDSGLRQTARAAQLATKYVAGVTYVRDFAGTGRNPLTPVPPDKQRAALELLATPCSPPTASASRRSSCSGWASTTCRSTGASINPDFSLSARVQSLQAGALGQLMSDTRRRAPARVRSQGRRRRRRSGCPSSTQRCARDLERTQDRPGHPAHPPQPAARARQPRRRRAAAPVGDDAGRRPRAAARRSDRAARRARRRRSAGTGISKEAQAHLAQAAATLDEALKAPVVRQSV